MNAAMLARILPFLLFMGFIGIEELALALVKKGVIVISAETLYCLYPVKTLSVGYLLYLFRRSYDEIEFKPLLSWRNLSVTVICGVAVFVLWINMDFTVKPSDLKRGFNPLFFQDQLLRTFMIFMRLTGATIVVPVMEEIFWRSFLLRYLVSQNYSKVAIGTFTWSSFLISAFLFGLEHDLIYAGIIAGIAYNLLLYSTRSIVCCIMSHALTNLLLGVYVLATHRWYFW